MSEEYKRVGVEIGWNVVRVSVLDSSGSSLEQYIDRVNLSELVQSPAPFLDPSQALQEAWEVLGLDSTSCRVAASIGPIFSGVGKIIKSGTLSEHLAILEEDAGVPIASRSLSSERFVYACQEHIDMTVASFEKCDVVLERLDLAPVVVQQVLPSSFNGTFTVNSGVGWLGKVSGNELVEATASPTVLSEAGVKIAKDKSGLQTLESISNVSLPESLLVRKQLDVSSLFVSVGAARGIGRVNEGFNLIDSEFDYEQQLENFDSESVDSFSDSLEESLGKQSEEIDLTGLSGEDFDEEEGKKKSGIFGKFLRNSSKS